MRRPVGIAGQAPRLPDLRPFWTAERRGDARMRAVDVDGLTFTYASGKNPAVRGLCFRIEHGEIFGFLGPSGAGKSTTQKLLIGLLRGYEGTVSVLGRDVADWGADYYEQIGVSFELLNHYLRLTGIENLDYFRALYRGATRRPEALLEMVGLAEDGERPVSQYSKGMKTRLGVARALLNNPQLIFLDEPTVGLDPASGRRIRNLIPEMKEWAHRLPTTHDMTVADELLRPVAFIVNGESGRRIAVRSQAGSGPREEDSSGYSLEAVRETRSFRIDGLGANADFWPCCARPPSTRSTLRKRPLRTSSFTSPGTA